MSDFKSNLQGIIAMSASMAGLILNDACVKIVSTSLPTGEIIFVRGLMAFVFISVIALRNGLLSQIGRLVHWSVGLCTLGEVFGTLLYLTALFHMPIANATAILQALPLLITAGAAIFLREKVGRHRWTAVLIGFAGVLIIVRPGVEGFDVYALLAFASMLCIAVRDLTIRALPIGLSTYTMTWFTTLGVTAMGLSQVPFEIWSMPTTGQFGLLALASGFLLVGYFGGITAMRLGELSVISPFRYTIVIWALALGYFVWSEVPDLATIVGTLIVVIMGIYTLIRERRVAAGN